MTNGWGKIFIGRRYQPNCPSVSTESFADLCQYGLRNGDMRQPVYSKTMHRAANELVRALLETDCDSICFIDSDAVFGSEALSELRDDEEGWQYDVLQAFTVKRGWPPEPMFLVEWAQQPQSKNRLRGTHFETNFPLDDDCIYPVDAVSLHFTLIRRELLEKMLSPDGPRHTYWFEYTRDAGEDITFSINARKVDAQMGMTTRLKVGHAGEIVTGWDTMVDFYVRKAEVEYGAPPATVDYLRTFYEARAQLAHLIAEYTGESPDEAYGKVNIGPNLVADRWKRVNPQTAEEVYQFYRETKEYLYDLALWNSSPSFQRLLQMLPDMRGKRVLDFGGGIGTVSEYLANNGNDVHYIDIPDSPVWQFSHWRFMRSGKYAVAMYSQDTLADALSDIAPVDAIVAIDVLEHIHPDEFEITVECLAAALAPDGILFAHNDWNNRNGKYPQHFDNRAAWEAFLTRHEFEQVGQFEWRKSNGRPIADEVEGGEQVSELWSEPVC